MVDENNIFLLDMYDVRHMEPDNYEKTKEEIIALLKANDFSIGASALLFKSIICSLGNTPINKL